MTGQGASPFGVCVLRAPGRNAARTVLYGHYVHEILAHAGVCNTSLAVDELADSLPELRVLLTVGEAVLPDGLPESLQAWVQAGGTWIAVGGACGAGGLFGVEVQRPAYGSWGGGQSTLGEGYLEPLEPAHPVLAHLAIPLHFFNGLPVTPAGGRVLARVLDAHGRPTERAALAENRPGEGRCLLVAPDVTGAVVRIQQGTAITRDGVPASDGTAPICDEVLKTGDGGVLDWHFDRQPLDGAPGLSVFQQPVADQWRELLLRAVFYAAREAGVPLPVLWLYPRGLPALGHISHDTDGNDPVKARRLLEVLAEARIHTTWCTILPGYERELTAAIREAGHELAMHFDAMSPHTLWEEAAFHEQWRQLADLFGEQAPVSNKNHYLRWEKDTEFFDWCERRGIRLEQSKGPSKSGEAGFNFGTCHLYRPVAPDGRLIDVYELPTLTQDLVVFAPEALLPPLLDAAARHHGILHLLFHPGHIDKPGVAEALLHSVEEGRKRGLEWWTAARIGEWERVRRGLRWLDYRRTEGGAAVRFRAADPLPGATLLWLAPGGSIRIDGSIAPAETVERWGFSFQSVSLDLPGDTERTVEVSYT